MGADGEAALLDAGGIYPGTQGLAGEVGVEVFDPQGLRRWPPRSPRACRAAVDRTRESLSRCAFGEKAVTAEEAQRRELAAQVLDGEGVRVAREQWLRDLIGRSGGPTAKAQTPARSEPRRRHEARREREESPNLRPWPLR